MKGIAKFSKVSFDEFMVGINEVFPDLSEEEVKVMYEEIKLPKRATKGSAGYDFYAPYTFTLEPGQTTKIPTGIRVRMDEEWVLCLFPRSGLGFKYRLQLNNTVGIIDSDYRGEIKVILINHSDSDFVIHNGDRIAQMVIAKHETASFEISNELEDTSREKEPAKTSSSGLDMMDLNDL